MNTDTINLNIAFPVTQSHQLVSITAREQQHGTIEAEAGFLYETPGLTAQERKGYCDRLVMLLGKRSPDIALFYMYEGTSEHQTWSGNSHQLSSYIAYARACSDKTLTNTWPATCASGTVGNNGDIGPVRSSGEAFEDKLETILNAQQAPQYFLYSSQQPLSTDCKGLLKELERSGITCLAIDSVNDIPEEITSLSNNTTADNQKPNHQPPVSKPVNKSSFSPKLVLAMLVALVAVLFPLMSDVMTPDTSDSNLDNPATAPLFTKVQPAYEFATSPDNRTTLKGGDKLSAGRVFAKLNVKQAGHYYWFVVGQNRKANEPQAPVLVAELFKIAGKNRQINTNTVFNPLPHGMEQTDDPGYLEFILVGAEKPNLQLETLLIHLKNDGFNEDPNVSQVLETLIARLEPNQVQRTRFNF